MVDFKAANKKRARQKKMTEAIVTVLDGFERGVFIRNTENDGAPDWAIVILPYIRAIAVLQAHIDEIENKHDHATS